MVNQWQPLVSQGERSGIKHFHLDQRASALTNQRFPVVKRRSLNTQEANWNCEIKDTKTKMAKWPWDTCRPHFIFFNFICTNFGRAVASPVLSLVLLLPSWPSPPALSCHIPNWHTLSALSLGTLAENGPTMLLTRGQRTETTRPRKDNLFFLSTASLTSYRAKLKLYRQNVDAIFRFFFVWPWSGTICIALKNSCPAYPF